MTHEYNYKTDEYSAAITKATVHHKITDHERRLVLLWWTEYATFGVVPEDQRQPDWQKREARAQEIIQRALGI